MSNTHAKRDPRYTRVAYAGGVACGACAVGIDNLRIFTTLALVTSAVLYGCAAVAMLFYGYRSQSKHPLVVLSGIWLLTLLGLELLGVLVGVLPPPEDAVSPITMMIALPLGWLLVLTGRALAHRRRRMLRSPPPG